MQKSHFPPLDGLRGIAILLVIMVHSFRYEGSSFAGRIVNFFATAGWVGVMLFFVLSGFLITGILLDTKGRPHYWRDFFARRSLRIFPLYFAFLALYFFVAPRVPYTAEHLSQPAPEVHVYYWTYLTNMMELLTGGPSTAATLDPLWSLAVEEQVYVVWPLLILLVPRRHLAAVLLGIAAFSFAWRFATRLMATGSIQPSAYWTPAALESFAFGAFVALLYRDRPETLTKWSPRVALGGGLFVAGMALGQRHFMYWENPLPMLTWGYTGVNLLGAGLIGVSITSPRGSRLNAALSGRWLRMFGKYSYGMYVFHKVVVELLDPLSIWRTGVSRSENMLVGCAFTIAVVACTFAAAWISWVVWESQFLKLKRFFPLSGHAIEAKVHS